MTTPIGPMADLMHAVEAVLLNFGYSWQEVDGTRTLVAPETLDATLEEMRARWEYLRAISVLM